MRIMVLGAGLVGSAIVRDLALEDGFSVIAADLNKEALEKIESRAAVKTVQADLRETDKIAGLVAECDLVVSAVPGFMGFETLKAIIEAGKHVVDISFFSEDPFLLDEPARAGGVTAVVDCGVAPGLCNILAGHVDSRLESIESYVCYVGGLPRLRRWPYEYKAVFSPADVLEEYTRPVHLVEYGHEVVRPPLSDIELKDFPAIGTLEAFNTDGLRTLRSTLQARFMREKTMRYPGHARLMKIFATSGFFQNTPIEVQGQPVSPRALTSALIFDQWKLKAGEEDLTVMQVVLEGQDSNGRCRYTYDLMDQYDQQTRTTSMARTTGYTATIVARQIAEGLFASRGVCPPEFVGREETCYENLLAEYAERNIHIRETIDRGSKMG